MTDVFLFDAIRTPFGKYGGALSGVRPDDLAATVLRALAERNDLDPATVDEVVLGDANGAGEDNRNVARMAALLAGWPTTVPGATVNRLCGSGLDAVMQASRSVQVGDASLAVAGGVESMSRSPLVMQKPEKAFPAGNQTLYSTALGWRMVNSKMPERWTVSLGESTEQLAERYGIGRDEQDAFAVRSHVNAARAWDEGFYDDHVVPVEGVELARDEGIRPDSSPEKLAKLKPVFRPQGTVTAANASPLNDGASALLLGDEAAGKRLGKAPLARIAGRGAAGVDPDVFGIGPVRAAEIALERAGIGWEDLAAVELNEAFAAQSLACLRDWSKLDPEIVNVNGGAIAIGHPLGASGGRILGTLAHHLRRTGGRWGLAAICIGVGQGLAVVLEAH
ncbi:acetyl-CoA acetyltransferases [Amycolatopsis lurida]|uniref:Probable acetyl-CoA acetyltransferase n=1 Tax=Amycolatopsis lurida NRRL 2430 TaxID=1460371 RepID=A0A2P2FIP5_AMYLU|nr:thiolase family protein [Amycolatopsis lurida]KFU76584.1 beta-ketoadipyl CoA thiolase [Amycolatopsis lurida NRRL 2430]SEE38300.1 acetyl-CoA acetyltransferases [Amycolatopsis lurida]